MTYEKEYSEDFYETYSNNQLQEMLDDLYETKHRLINERKMVERTLDSRLVSFTDEQIDSLNEMLDDISDALVESEKAIENVLSCYNFSSEH